MRRRVSSKSAGIFALLLIASAAMAETPAPEPAFAKGADLSMLQYLEDHGTQYRENGQLKDPLLIFKDHGCNYVRLRLFVNPSGKGGQVNTLAYTLALAKRVRQMGFPWMLDLHYSDRWADPGKQFIPAAWQGLSHAQLQQRVYDYTLQTLAAFQAAGCPPGIVQVGNEVNDGMLFPDGGPLGDPAKWKPFADLLKAGVRAVREAGPMKVMIHSARGGDKQMCKWFFDNLRAQGVDFDLIGLSYYPLGDGPTDRLKSTLDFLSATYYKDIIVVETGFTSAAASGVTTEFPATPVGQKSCLEAVIRTVAATPGGRGRGVFYWAPEWIARRTPASAGLFQSREARALFDLDGNMLPGLQSFATPVGGGPL